MVDFFTRVQSLPTLGVGVSTEYGALGHKDTLDAALLQREHPEYAQFLEVGVEVVKGLDAPTQAWCAQGLPTTYHFLDINLDDPRDFDEAWLLGMQDLLHVVKPAWLCGDAGLWHFGKRGRGHMLLLPPILTDDAAWMMAEGICTLRDRFGLEVLPENPPGAVYAGDLHLLDFFARVCERADTGMLLDCAHLAIYQHAMKQQPRDGFDHFPWERVVEVHIAGGVTMPHPDQKKYPKYTYIDDRHTTEVLPATWQIFDEAAAKAKYMKAVIFECERNPTSMCLSGFAQIRQVLQKHQRCVLPDAVNLKKNGALIDPLIDPLIKTAAQRKPVENAARQRIYRQQAMQVRMLHDEKLVHDLYQQVQKANPKKQDHASEYRILVNHVDQAAYTVDAERAARTLASLLTEFPSSCALLLANKVLQSHSGLLNFFSSHFFAKAVAIGGMLSSSFAAFLESLAKTPLQKAVIRVEALAAAARWRTSIDLPLVLAPLEEPKSSIFALAAGVAVASLPMGAIDATAFIRSQLDGVMRAERCALEEAVLRWHPAPTSSVWSSIRIGKEQTGGCAQLTASGESLGEISLALYALLHAAASPHVSLASLRRVAAEQGAEEHEIDEIFQSLLDDGLLVRIHPLAAA